MLQTFKSNYIETCILQLVFLIEFQNGVDINKADFYGLTALHYASEQGNVEIMRKLLRAGAQVDCTDQNRSVLTPIHIATCSGQLQAVQILVQHKCDVNAQDM